MKYESHFLNPEQSKTSIRSRIPNKIDLYTYIFVFYLILKMQIQVSLMVNLNTKVRFVGIKSNLPDYPIIFFSLSWKKIFLFATNKNFQTATWEMRTLKFRNQLFPFSGSFTASSSSCRAELRGCKIQCVHLKNCYGLLHWGWRECTTETNTLV